ncbi:COMM domain-containing protein 7-like isoform X2 [Homarus americanus]|uniref:COMM domain-containing protein 7-like isoform X2 n=1 Tax=Homarus americanus TaxID=6706 RepID=UPI001C475004|nr:COMM domain-containing protein 7-like isoform X2 [Homarus americanus]
MSFLVVWDASLQRVANQRKQSDRCAPYYVVTNTRDDVELHVEMLCGILESVISDTVSGEDLVSLLTSSGLQRDRANLFVSQYDHLQELVALRKCLENPREQLVDLQWKFGVVAGSSSEGEAGRTFVQVKFISRTASENLVPRYVEMSLHKFYDFLHQLEKAKASLEYMNYL